jgi:hypothetical protein
VTRITATELTFQFGMRRVQIGRLKTKTLATKIDIHDGILGAAIFDLLACKECM